MPGEPGVAEAGLPLVAAAEREGGGRNGVLTAIEDFIATRDDLELVTVPAFFGFGIVWSRDREWAGRMEGAPRVVERYPAACPAGGQPC